MIIKRVSDLDVEAKGFLAWSQEDDHSPLIQALGEITRSAATLATDSKSLRADD